MLHHVEDIWVNWRQLWLIVFYLFKVSLDFVVFISMVLISSNLTYVHAKPTDSSIPQGTSSSRNITQMLTEKTGRNPRAISRRVQPTGTNAEQATNNQGVLLTAGGAGFNITRFPSSLSNNPCIKRFRDIFIYNYFFAIPICKKHQGCYAVKKIVNFGKGRTFAITTNCQRVKHLPQLR